MDVIQLNVYSTKLIDLQSNNPEKKKRQNQQNVVLPAYCRLCMYTTCVWFLFDIKTDYLHCSFPFACSLKEEQTER